MLHSGATNERLAPCWTNKILPVPAWISPNGISTCHRFTGRRRDSAAPFPVSLGDLHSVNSNSNKAATWMPGGRLHGIVLAAAEEHFPLLPYALGPQRGTASYLLLALMCATTANTFTPSVKKAASSTLSVIDMSCHQSTYMYKYLKIEMEIEGEYRGSICPSPVTNTQTYTCYCVFCLYMTQPLRGRDLTVSEH
ncbi:hypothetical protein I7I51_08822 [Histoplasma capsulatum]|uniref:Uncharacterized protein n=1 Tax=Ajellomyces capsulatus TaxID=5037 RepID=A0A8A1M5B5_AJECA|nr:hypothetical protein I7I51_08822 [Histoplasma capsulatum]